MISALLNRSHPYPQETLTSWMWRLTLENYLPSPSILLRYLHQKAVQTTPILQHQLLHMQTPALFQGFSELMYLSPSELYVHTLHIFAHALTHPGQANETIELSSGETVKLIPPRLHHDFYTRRFGWCPKCLAQARCVRLHWHIPFVTCCTTHHCWLLNHCPYCEKHITEADIVTGVCADCGFRLEEAEAVPVPEDDLLFILQRTVMSWLYGTQPPDLGFPQTTENVLLRVLLGLRYATQRAGNGWEFHHFPPHIPRPNLDILQHRLLTRFERGSLYTTAFRGVVDWPHGFYAFLDAYRTRPACKGRLGLRGQLGQIYVKWISRFWAHESFDFVQTAYNSYLLANFPATQIVSIQRAQIYPELVVQTDYLTLHHASAVFDIAPTTLHWLIAVGKLKAHNIPPYPNRIWLARDELEAVQLERKKAVPLAVVSRLLGVGKQRVYAMLQAGLLNLSTGFVANPDPGIGIELSTVHTFLSDLQQRVTIAQPDKVLKPVSLVKLCLHLATLGVNLPDVFQYILDGRLTAHHPRPDLLPLTDLWFLPETVTGIFSDIKEEHDWMGLVEVLAYLKVGRGLLQYFMDKGYLLPDKSFERKHFFRRAEVVALRERFVRTPLAKEILKFDETSIANLVANGLLHPVCGPGVNGYGHYMFERHEVLTWHDRYILRRDFALLTPHTGRLLRWLKKTGVVPLMKHPIIYLRAPVLEVLQQLKHSKWPA